MKAIINAGGLGTRLSPLTNPLSKHLLPVGDQPMIAHVIKTLVAGGISEIMLSLNAYNPGLYLEMLGDGKKYGCDLTYKYIPTARGPGEGLLLAKNFVRNEHFVLALGDGLFFTPLNFTGLRGPHMFLVPLKGLDDPGKYTQAKIKNNRVAELAYKPKQQFSDLAQASCYVFPPDIFPRIQKLLDDGCADVHISDLTEQYVNEGGVGYTLLPPKSHIDCGTIEALHRATAIVMDGKRKRFGPRRATPNAIRLAK
jgi:glucose-1-phosphate thymidylyltransferase